MSYPPYNPQGPGMYPPPEHMTTPLSYPMNPGSAAPMGGYPPTYPQNSAVPYPSNQSPYPSNPSMPMPTSSPFPSYPGQPSPYPPTSQPSPYPQASHPSPYPPASHPSPYPPNPSQPSSYPPNPSQPSSYPPNPSQPSSYPPNPSQPSSYPPNPSYPPMSSQYQSSYPPAGQNPTSQTSSYPPQGSPYATQSHSYQSNSQPPHSGAGGYPHAQNSHIPGNQHSGQQQPSKGTPTVRPANPFDPKQDAEILRKAMKGFGTDEKAIINVLAYRTSYQRQEIAVKFKTMYGKDLIKDLKSELSGNLEDLVVALMMPISSLLARDLHKAVSCIGTEEETIIEILCTATNQEIHAIQSAYRSMYGSSLEDDMASDTSGSFRRLLVSLCQGARDENYMVDHTAAQVDAQQLLRAGELKFGTDESSFNAILCSRSYPQLNQVFIEYQRITGHDFTKAVENEFSGDIKDGLLAIVKSVKDRYGYFAEQLCNSMKGFGTKDKALQRIVAVRSEIDMVEIKRAFSAKYGKSLEEFIQEDTSGDYKKCLLALVSD